jgi:hypothetical protein
MTQNKAADIRVEITLFPPRIDVEHFKATGLTQATGLLISTGQIIRTELPSSTAVVCVDGDQAQCKHAMLASIVELEVVTGSHGEPVLRGHWLSRFGRSVTISNQFQTTTKSISDDVDVAAEGATDEAFELAIGTMKEIRGPLGSTLRLSAR